VGIALTAAHDRHIFNGLLLREIMRLSLIHISEPTRRS
jgi:hypothetical protein